MKMLYNSAIHGTGYLCILIGFIMCIAAAGCADLDGAMVDIIHYEICGLAAFLIGFFLTRWKI